MDYKAIVFEDVENVHCEFYKLEINGKCQFDEFVEEVNRISQDKKAYEKMIAWMDNFIPTTMYPKEKFRNIPCSGRCDIYEFKHKELRIYVVAQYPNVFIVRGGYKKEQQKDIDKVKRDVKDFPQEFKIE